MKAKANDTPKTSFTYDQNATKQIEQRDRIQWGKIDKPSLIPKRWRWLLTTGPHSLPATLYKPYITMYCYLVCEYIYYTITLQTLPYFLNHGAISFLLAEVWYG